MAASYQTRLDASRDELRALPLEKQIAIKDILFATDFAAPARRALPFAVALAARYGARMYAAHVIQPEAYVCASADSSERVQQETATFAAFSLNQIADPLRERGLECNPILSLGSVPETIAELVQAHHVDLLVMGTSSRAGWSRVLVGSVTEQMIRQSPCPVLTVASHITTLASCGIRCIVCATDFSSGSLRAAAYAISLAQEYGAHLSVLHVLPGRPCDVSHMAIQLTQRRLREVLPEMAELAFEPELVVETGDAGDQIVNLAVEMAADIIAMGRQGSTSAENAPPLGSTAKKVVGLGPCPVLTVPTHGHRIRE